MLDGTLRLGEEGILVNRRVGKLIVALLVATTVIAIPAAGAAQFEPEPVASGKAALYEGNPDLAKVSSDLMAVREAHAAGRDVAPQAGEPAAMEFVRGYPQLDIRLTELTPEVVARAEAVGFQTSGAFPQYGRLVGTISPAQYDELASIVEITTISPNHGAATNVGVVTSQADLSINAAAARSAFGVDGSGITVGVISDTFNRGLGGTLSGGGCNQTLTGSAPQGTGDLPASVTVLEPGPATGIDEGAAMAELISDLAPGADIMFHSAFISIPDFAAGITELVNCGADVIVDDVIYFGEPMFQDGIIADAAQDAVDAGVPYYSSAGNHGGFGVRDFYDDAGGADDDTTFPATGVDFHTWDNGSRYAPIVLDPFEAVRIVLGWDQPFSGSQGPGSANDLDLYMCTAQNAASCTSFSANVQGCSAGARSGDPSEILVFQNTTGVTSTFYLAVDHYCGNQSGVDLRVSTFGANVSSTSVGWDPTVFDEQQIYGHAAAADAMAVAAVDYREIDQNGNFTSPNVRLDVEPFSARGGQLPFYFDAQGNPLPGAPVFRFKPEMTAPDGTNTTFFGQDVEPDGWPNFFGTSAAAPHAAAVAALMLEANGSLDPASTNDILRGTAIDMENNGVDALSGSGLIDAFNAVQVADAGGLCFGEVPTNLSFTDGPDVINGTGGDDVLIGGRGNDKLNGGGGNDKICGGGGNDKLTGGPGNDKMDGQVGTDQVKYAKATTGVTVDLGAKTATGQGNDTLKSIENIVGSPFDDVIDGTSDANYIKGLDGNDVLDGKSGDDTLIGSADDDILYGRGGNDELKGAANDDLILPGSGSDTVLGGNGSNTVSFEDSPNPVKVDLSMNTATGFGNDTLKAFNILLGSPQDDDLTGNNNKNVIRGLGGDDRIDGLLANDTLYGLSGDDVIYGREGNDKLFGGGGSNTLYGGPGNDRCVDFVTQTGCETLNAVINTVGQLPRLMRIVL
jgi:Ca2+-binding RTX toxin-like protein